MIQTISAVSSHVGVMALASTGTPYGILYDFFKHAIVEVRRPKDPVPLFDALGKLPGYKTVTQEVWRRKAPHMSEDEEWAEAESGADDSVYAALELRDMQDYLGMYVAAFLRDRELLGQVLDAFVEHGGVTVPQNVQELRLPKQPTS